MVYIITIKWMMGLQEKIGFSSMSQTPRLRKFLLSYKDKVAIKNCKKVPRDGYSSSMAFATSCHPMDTGLS